MTCNVKRRIEGLAQSVPARIAGLNKSAPQHDSLWSLCRQDRAVIETARRLGFDVTQPTHLTEMLVILSTGFVGAPPERWTPYSLSQLAMNFLRLRERYPEASNQELYKLLSDRNLYKGTRPSTLGRVVRNALDRYYNPLLRDVLAMMPRAVAIVNTRRKQGQLPDWRTLPSYFERLKHS